MIQVDQALSIIAENSSEMPVKKIKVGKSLGFILAEAIYSPIDMPPFRQSAMDGYAFVHSELSTFSVVSSSQAGDYSNLKLGLGTYYSEINKLNSILAAKNITYRF